MVVKTLPCRRRALQTPKLSTEQLMSRIVFENPIKHRPAQQVTALFCWRNTACPQDGADA
jgi:hypothetical protein